MFARSKFQNLQGVSDPSNAHHYDFQTNNAALDGSNLIDCNGKCIVVPWRPPSGRALVLSQGNPDRVPTDVPLLSTGGSSITDLALSPHDDSVLAAGGENGDLTVVRFATDGRFVDENSVQVSHRFTGHSHRIAPVRWSKVAENILASAGAENAVRVWDASAGQSISAAEGFDNLVTGLDFSLDGRLLLAATKSTQNNVYLIDARTGDRFASANVPSGGRAMRALFVSDNTFVTSGHSPSMHRTLRLWDVRKLSESVSSHEGTNQVGATMPLLDDDSSVLLVAYRGGTKISTFDLSSGEIRECATYSGSDPIVGAAMLPKRFVDVRQHELCRVAVITSAPRLYNISFKVPRVSTNFQDDIFASTWDGTPALTNEEWLSGKDATLAKTLSLHPDGMIAESTIQKPKRESTRNLIQGDDRRFVDTEKEAIDRLNNLMTKFSGPPPQSDVQGANDDEWDD
eukprot:c11225_g1_i2.p1 GENE.c11225_g1_i2~~c11225_g1_i2.p1  ORF type:complete len:466 (+),score=98.56 c11225_g1_i2:30-1400(+)